MKFILASHGGASVGMLDTLQMLLGPQEDIEAVNQERADKGLEKLGVPPATNIKKKPGEKELMSDDEVKELAKM